jgi:hypothetical protein
MIELLIIERSGNGTSLEIVPAHVAGTEPITHLYLLVRVFAKCRSVSNSKLHMEASRMAIPRSGPASGPHSLGSRQWHTGHPLTPGISRLVPDPGPVARPGLLESNYSAGSVGVLI